MVNHVLEQDHPEGEVVVQDKADDDQGANQASHVEECQICATNGELCGICQRKARIREMRAIAKRNQELQANKMLERSN